MLRIPNPGSNIDEFIRIFQDLHPFLKDKTNFDLDDITAAMIAKNNVTSQGAIGAEALRRSRREDRSLDGLYNQSKMYSELYRSLGWIHSTSSSLTFCITTLGHHLATAADPKALTRECLLGIAFPNEVLNVKGNQSLRVFGTILLTIAELGTLSRDEMTAGPMCIADDTNPRLVATMIHNLRQMRRRPGALDRCLDEISSTRNIKRGSTMTNYTRFPMAALPWAGWATKSRGGMLTVTAEGRVAAERIRAIRDFRLDDFIAAPDGVKGALIVSTSYRMLERGGFDLDAVSNTLVRDERAIYDAGYCGELLFSPFQQLARSTIALHAKEMLVTEGIDAIDSTTAELETGISTKRPTAMAMLVQVTTGIHQTFDRAQQLEQELVKVLTAVEGQIDKAAEFFIHKFAQANKDVFYPLVADLFAVVGFDCRLSRAGVNNVREDALIVDDHNSIPIEIKSPGEEPEISVKGVRQALENKIILLSRKGNPTRPSTTSLVVGFNPPNERSEVHELIDDIHHAFHVNVGIIDFRTLLMLALKRVHSTHPLALPGFTTMKGLLRVEVAPSGR
jgi:hypothetical protein